MKEGQRHSEDKAEQQHQRYMQADVDTIRKKSAKSNAMAENGGEAHGCSNMRLPLLMMMM